jgi:c(7)-type cytochrome triheme protein
MTMKWMMLAAALGTAVFAGGAQAANGKATYESVCALCHGPGLAGAPRFGNAAEWAPRIERGLAALQQSALHGTAKGMPAKGGRLDLSDADVKSAVEYMVAQVQKPAEKPAEKPKPKPAATASNGAGKATYDATCSLCHGAGIAGAPRFGNADDWSPRIARGIEALYNSALHGTDKGMPAKGGNADLAPETVKAAVDYMVAQVHDAKPSAKASPDAPKAAADKPAEATKAAAAAEPAPEPKAAPTPEKPAAEAPKATAAADKPAPESAKPPAVTVSEVNSFNRLLKPAGKRNLPPPEDGIHDPENDGTHALQPPMTAFETLPKSPAGNRVNWMQALNEKKVDPRWDRNDPKAEPTVMDLNIVRKVKGSMPDVVYPHKQHTEWLDCSNCHPAIFTPQSGANQISMAAILLGQKCGVCHGKVAFPVSECRLCHSKKKDPQATTAATDPKAATEAKK